MHRTVDPNPKPFKPDHFMAAFWILFGGSLAALAAFLVEKRRKKSIIVKESYDFYEVNSNF